MVKWPAFNKYHISTTGDQDLGIMRSGRICKCICIINKAHLKQCDKYY